MSKPLLYLLITIPIYVMYEFPMQMTADNSKNYHIPNIYMQLQFV